MYEVYFYVDRKGNQPVYDYIKSLIAKNGKDSRIKANKINDYITVLAEHGITAGEPYIKHLDAEIWELRPLRDRILFAAWVKGGFVLLHVFMKKTAKTPAREIKKAKAELADLLERGVEFEQ